ncbi:MAG TPA: FecR family protein [Chryseolinea sp.]|nr:FecR family protein [Chryseolinea sp.]
MRISKDKSDPLRKDELEKLSNLLERYLENRGSSEENQAIEQWFESLAGKSETTFQDESESKVNIWTKIESATNPDHGTPLGAKSNSSFSYRWLRWAAAIAVLFLSTFFLYQLNQRDENTLAAFNVEDNWVVKTNTTVSIQNLRLPDSSEVILKPQAKIKYPVSFNDNERVVYFNGDAFFAIQKNETKPFKVITGDIITRVLGTSFNVKANDQSSVVQVDVRTGRVSVYEKSKTKNQTSDGVILTPNQKVTYSKKNDTWITELVSEPLPIVNTPEVKYQLIYKDQVMKNVLREISNIYGIEIIVSNDRIYDCNFTGDLSEMELYDMLKVICKTVRATYEVHGTRILVNGDGCK